MRLKELLLGNLALLIIITGTITGCVYCITPILLLLPFSPSWCMRLGSVIVGSWMCFAITLIEVICGVTIRVFGDELRYEDRQTLLLLNHRTRLDYLYFWSYLFHRRMINDHKIVLKHQLTMIPAAGTSMQSGCFIFLRRAWQQDHLALERYLHFYDTAKHNTKLLIFPEGTDLRPDSIESSNKFAAKNNLPPYKYVLHPRTTGFAYLVEAMRSLGRLDSIADVTVGYAVNVPRAEEDLLAGRWPRVIDFFVHSYPISQIPSGEEQLSSWLVRRWSNKERFLDWYYSQSTDQRVKQTAFQYIDAETGSAKEYQLIFRSGISMRNVAVTAAMTAMAFVGCLLFYLNTYVLVYGITVLIAETLVTIRFGGIDKLLINYNWILTGRHKESTANDQARKRE